MMELADVTTQDVEGAQRMGLNLKGDTLFIFCEAGCAEGRQCKAEDEQRVADPVRGEWT